MSRKLGLRAILPFLPACALAAGFTTLARAALGEDRQRLAGKWAFNQSQSDDANEKVHDAKASAKPERAGYPGGGGDYPIGGENPSGGSPAGGGGYPRGGGIGFPGGRGGTGGSPIDSGGINRGSQQGGSPEAGVLLTEDLERLAANPKILNIEQDDRLISVTDDAGQIKNLYLDGKKHKGKNSGGKSSPIKAHWDRDRLVARSRLGHSGQLTETYQLSPDGKQLIVFSQLDNAQLSLPLVIRRVYDRTAETAK